MKIKLSARSEETMYGAVYDRERIVFESDAVELDDQLELMRRFLLAQGFQVNGNIEIVEPDSDETIHFIGEDEDEST